MTLALHGLGAQEVLLIIVSLLFVVLLGNYGKNTVFGYWGSVLLAMFTTPIIAFIILYYVKNKTANLSN
jgi:hypothetical protein